MLLSTHTRLRFLYAVLVCALYNGAVMSMDREIIYSTTLSHFHADENPFRLAQYNQHVKKSGNEKKTIPDKFKDLARASIDRSKDDDTYLEYLRNAQNKNYKPAYFEEGKALLKEDIRAGIDKLLEAAKVFKNKYVYFPAIKQLAEYLYSSDIQDEQKIEIAKLILQVRQTKELKSTPEDVHQFIENIKLLALNNQDWYMYTRISTPGMPLEEEKITSNIINKSTDLPFSCKEAYEIAVAYHNNEKADLRKLLEYARTEIPEANFLCSSYSMKGTHGFAQDREQSLEYVSTYVGATPDISLEKLCQLTQICHDQLANLPQKEAIVALRSIENKLLAYKDQNSDLYNNTLKLCQAGIVQALAVYFRSTFKTEDVPLSHCEAYDIALKLARKKDNNNNALIKALLKYASLGSLQAMYMSGIYSFDASHGFTQDILSGIQYLKKYVDLQQTDGLLLLKCNVLFTQILYMFQEKQEKELINFELIKLLYTMHTKLLRDKHLYTDRTYYKTVIERCHECIISIGSLYVDSKTDMHKKEIIDSFEQIVIDIYKTSSEDIKERAGKLVQDFFQLWLPKAQASGSDTSKKIQGLQKLLAHDDELHILTTDNRIIAECELACYLYQDGSDDTKKKAYTTLSKYKKQWLMAPTSELHAFCSDIYANLTCAGYSPKTEIDTFGTTMLPEAIKILRLVAGCKYASMRALAKLDLAELYLSNATSAAQTKIRRYIPLSPILGFEYLDAVLTTELLDSKVYQRATILHKKTFLTRMNFLRLEESNIAMHTASREKIFKFSDIQLLYGNAYEKQKRYDDALTAYKKAKSMLGDMLALLLQAKCAHSNEEKIEHYTKLIAELNTIDDNEKKYPIEYENISYFVKRLLDELDINQCELFSAQSIYHVCKMRFTHMPSVKNLITTFLLFELLDKKTVKQLEQSQKSAVDYVKILATSGLYESLVQESSNTTFLQRILLRIHVRRATNNFTFLQDKQQHYDEAQKLIKSIIEKEKETSDDILETQIVLADDACDFKALVNVTDKKAKRYPDNLEHQLEAALAVLKEALKKYTNDTSMLLTAQRRFIHAVEKIADRGHIDSIFIMIAAHLEEKFLPYLYLIIDDPSNKCKQLMASLTAIKKDTHKACIYLEKAAQAESFSGLLLKAIVLIHEQETFKTYGSKVDGVKALKKIKTLEDGLTKIEQYLCALLNKKEKEAITIALTITTFAADPHDVFSYMMPLYKAIFLDMKGEKNDVIKEQIFLCLQRLVHQDDKTIASFFETLGLYLDSGLFTKFTTQEKCLISGLKKSIEFVLNIGTGQLTYLIMSDEEAKMLETVTAKNNYHKDLCLQAFITLGYIWVQSYYSTDLHQLLVNADIYFAECTTIIKKNYTTAPYYQEVAKKLRLILRQIEVNARNMMTLLSKAPEKNSSKITTIEHKIIPMLQKHMKSLDTLVSEKK